MRTKMMKSTRCAAIVTAAIATAGVHAGTGSGAPTTVTGGTSSEAVTLSGTITFSAPSVQWERLNATGNITLADASSADMTDGGKQLVVRIPTAGSASGLHTAVGFRTSTGFRSSGSNAGLQIELMFENVGANIVSRVGATGIAGSDYTAGVPIVVNGTVSGSAQVPLYSATVLQYAGDDGNAHTVKSCISGGTLVTGNVLSSTAETAGAVTSSGYAGTRTLMASHGHRAQVDAVRAIKATVGGSNTAADTHVPTGQAAATCDKPTSAAHSYLVDHATMVRAADMRLNFVTAPTSSTVWSVPLNFRATYI